LATLDEPEKTTTEGEEEEEDEVGIGIERRNNNSRKRRRKRPAEFGVREDVMNLWNKSAKQRRVPEKRQRVSENGKGRPLRATAKSPRSSSFIGLYCALFSMLLLLAPSLGGQRNATANSSGALERLLLQQQHAHSQQQNSHHPQMNSINQLHHRLPFNVILILPEHESNNDKFGLTVTKVRPVIDTAIEDVIKHGIMPAGWINITYHDSRYWEDTLLAERVSATGVVQV
jgi:hypothetical protein